MTTTLADRARANRRAALATLNTRVAGGQNVVSIFDRVIQRRKTVPEFHTCRRIDAQAVRPVHVHVPTDPVAA